MLVIFNRIKTICELFLGRMIDPEEFFERVRELEKEYIEIKKTLSGKKGKEVKK